MNKKISLLLLLPIAVTACSNGNLSFEQMKEKVDGIEYETLYPYYAVDGYLDFNGQTTTVQKEFTNEPSTSTFVEYARYNEGFYCPDASVAERSTPKEEVVIFAMASHSYWLRAPLKIDKETFYVVNEDGEENMTCAHYTLSHIITSYMDEKGSINPSDCYIYYEEDSEGNLIFGGNEVHTEFTIDNYPYYPNYATHPELGGEWDENDPLPCYKNKINAKVNIKFVYNKDGWLIRETLSTIGYDYNNPTVSQVSLDAAYGYKFE